MLFLSTSRCTHSNYFVVNIGFRFDETAATDHIGMLGPRDADEQEEQAEKSTCHLEFGDQ